MKRKLSLLGQKILSFFMALMIMLSNIGPGIAYAMEEGESDNYYNYELYKDGYYIKSLTKKGRENLKESSYEISIPEEFKDIPVVGIKEAAFKNEGVLKLNLSKNIKYIEDEAFYNDKYIPSLSEITMDGGYIEEVGKRAFYGNDIKVLDIVIKHFKEDSFANNKIEEIDLTYTKSFTKTSFRGNDLKKVVLNINSSYEEGSFNEDTEIEEVKEDLGEDEEEEEPVDYLKLREDRLKEEAEKKALEEEKALKEKAKLEEADNAEKEIERSKEENKNVKNKEEAKEEVKKEVKETKEEDKKDKKEDEKVLENSDIKLVEPKKLNDREYKDLKDKNKVPKRLSFKDFLIKTAKAAEISEGTWIAEPVPTEYNIQFDKNNDKAIGEMISIKTEKNKNVLMPNSSYIAKNQRVISYSKNPKAKVPEYKVEQSYKNIGNVGETITLYAIWEDINTNLAFKNGELEFYLKDGDTVELPDLPANSDYEIYEETEAGWSLVESSNDRGKIKSSETIEANFVNDYNSKVAYAKINGSKLLENDRVNVKGYEFEVLENGNVLYTLISDENGNFETPLIKYDKAGNHTYTIREKSKSTNKILKDESEFKVNVEVLDNNGVLTASVSYPKNVIFNNTRVKKSLTIKKKIESNVKNLDGEFKVRVSLSNESKDRIVTLNKANNYETTIGNLLEGTSYTVEEIDIPKGYSLKSYSKKEGVIGNKNEVLITNNYESKGSFTINLKKILEGRDLKEGEFKFNLYDENNKLIAASKNNADGTINSFGSIEVKNPGLHKFILKEDLSDKDNSIDYDMKPIEISVNAIDNKNGTLTVESPTYSRDTFTNKVKKGTLMIEKQVNNIIKDDLFEFKVKLLDKDGNPLKGTFKYTSNKDDLIRDIKNDSIINLRAGEVISITDLPDGSSYEVEEINTSKDYKLSDSKDTKGVISSNKVSKALFINSYNLNGIYQIKAKKELSGRTLKDKEFEFLLLSEDGEILDRAYNDENGNITFKPMKFTDEDLNNKNRSYRIIESKGDDKDIVYDISEYEVKLDLSEENGQIKVSDSFIKNNKKVDTISFKNTYDNTKSKVVISKKVLRKGSGDTEFSIKVNIKKPNEDETSRVVKLRKDENIEFDNLPAGTKIFVEEINLPDRFELNHYEVNDKSFAKDPVNITTESGKNYNVDIINNKIIHGSFDIEGSKLMNNKIPKENEFEFELLDSRNNQVAVTKNDKNGKFKFKVEFSKSDLGKTYRGTKHFYIKEIQGNDVRVDYDKSVYEVVLRFSKDSNDDIKVDKVTILKDGKDASKIEFNNKSKLIFELPKTGSKLILLFFISAGLVSMAFSLKAVKRLKRD